MYTSNKQQAASLESGVPSVGSIVWAAGRSRAQQAINLYANLDYLRPYFDVEPNEVAQRLIRSLIPARSSRDENIKPELYGPSMIVFTLAAILIYQMKVSNLALQDGTLIGTSFFVCFGYWVGSSFGISSISYICNTQLSLIQILSINGYALFSHCVVLFLATYIHTAHDRIFFYGLWAFFGGLAAVRLALLIMSRTINRQYRIALGVLIILIHMFFLLYLHFAYHAIAETVAHALNKERRNAATTAAAASTTVSTAIPISNVKSVPSLANDTVTLPLLPRQPQKIFTNTSKILGLLSSSNGTIVKKE